MADDQFQYVKLPDGSYGKFPSSASDDQIRTVLASQFPKEFAAAKAAPAADPRIGTASAAPTGVGPWLNNLESDVRYGTGNTLPGKILQKLGAKGTAMGVNEDNPIGKTILGPIHVAQGEVQAQQGAAQGNYQKQAGGGLKMLGGMVDAANIPLTFLGNAPGNAEALAGKVIPGVMMEQGGQKIGQASAAAAKVPLNISAPGNQALKVKELLDAGAPTGGVSRLINQFIRRVSDPEGAPMTFEEARRFYTNATAKTSAEELQKMSGPMRREFSQFVGRLGESLTGAAGQVGQADTYTSGMQQFAAGAARQRALVNALKYGGSAAGGGLLTHYLVEKATH